MGPDRAIKEILNEAVVSAKRTHPGVPTHVSTVNNGAALTLIDRSGEAALIVLGARGHSAVVGLVGSVSVAVSAHSRRYRCPTSAPSRRVHSRQGNAPNYCIECWWSGTSATTPA
ncbi:universal stress protein [Actinoplanes sp. NPDC049118]|uniref:universal stress protein n=1 Tax=Actinoplanes sp. NPDC049118 TaxID=3155769 RepID=UPI0033CBAA23